MNITEQDLKSMLAKNPNLSISPSSASRKKKGVQQRAYPGAEEKVVKKAKYRNLKVFVFENGLVLELPAGQKPSEEEYGKIKEIYDSRKEYERGLELELLQKAGKIKDLKRQVPFVLQPSFERDGKKIQAIMYKADFTYVISDTNEKVVEDVKGIDKKTGKALCTQDFKLKWKMLQYLYPFKFVIL